MTKTTRSAMNATNGRQWFLLCLSVVECLLCTGVTFGLSALTIALKRDGQFAETCGGAEGATMLEGEGEGEWGGERLKFNAMFTAGTVSVPLSMMFWGRLIDLKGVKWVRLVSLSLFTVGCVLFAESDSKTFDAYVVSCVFLLSLIHI